MSESETMGMVERVARAIHEHGLSRRALEGGYAYDAACEEEKKLARGYARAAIEAMGSPPQHVLGRLVNDMAGNELSWDASEGTMLTVIRKLIDAALADPAERP